MIPNLALSIVVAASTNLLANPSFDDGLAGWQRSNQVIRMEAVNEDGRTAARITVGPTDEIGFPYLYQEIPVNAAEILSISTMLKGKGTSQGVGAYMAIEFYNQAGERLTFSQTAQIHDDNMWISVVEHAAAPPEAVKARGTLILNGRGEAYFDDVSLTKLVLPPLKPIDGEVTLNVTSEVVTESTNGFGAEDDGWFYNPENAARGVTEDDYKLREARIEWIDPDWIRIFFWHKDWCPSGDWKAFTFDSPNMQSHYRSLDLYQRIGAKVNITGTEWGMKDPYADPEQYAHAIGELYEFLIRNKGYTCISDWTLSNEPNGAFANFGYSFDHFVKIHLLVKTEFERRGLNIRIVGSDDAQDVSWYRKCVANEDYFKVVDLFSSHRYFPYPDRVLTPFFFSDRLDPLAAKSSKKPFVVGEFGFHDSRSGTTENPLMESYPYAVWTAGFVIEGLNQGVAGYSIWCLHEMVYPGGGFMNYGLWNYKEDNWKVRPVYHAWANFTRLTEPGEIVLRVLSSHPRQVKGAVVGDTLFWVNTTDETVHIQLALDPQLANDPLAADDPQLAQELHSWASSSDRVCIQTEGTLQGDRESGTFETLNDGGFVAPPQSFGYIE